MLTPDEIRNRDFLVSLRGYDKDEVRAFLNELADSYRTVLAQARGGSGDAEAPAPAAPAAAEPAAAPAAETPAAVSPFAAIGLETQKILEAAHAAGEEIRRQAEAEAERVRSNALQDAEGEVVHLQEVTVELREQIAALEDRRAQIAEGLRQARETVDLALLEIDATEVAALPADPADPRGSVLVESDDDTDAADDAADDAAADDDVADPDDEE